jgi:hypothetical protein
MITPRQLWYPLFFISGPAVSALLITYTTKKSFPRWLGLGFIGYISYLTFESANGLTSNHRDNGILASLPFIQFCHAANLLLINAIDRQDLPSPKAISDNFVSFSSSLGLFVNFRGIGTKWVVKNTPRFPNYYQTQSPGRAIFYFRQLALVVWLYLLGDMIGFSGTLPSLDEQERMFGEGTEYLFLDATTEQWGARISSSLMTWFLAGRVFMCCYYSMFSLVCIAVGLSSPKDWPPAFNSVSEAYTLRNFWGWVSFSTNWSYQLICDTGIIGINGFAGRCRLSPVI